MKIIKIYGNANELKGLDVDAVCNKAETTGAVIVTVGASTEAFDKVIFEAQKKADDFHKYNVRFSALKIHRQAGRTRAETMNESIKLMDVIIQERGWETVETIDLRGWKPVKETKFTEEVQKFNANVKQDEIYKILKKLGKDAHVKIDPKKLEGIATKTTYSYRVKNWRVSDDGYAYYHFHGCTPVEQVLDPDMWLSGYKSDVDGKIRDLALKQLAYLVALAGEVK